MFYTSKSNLKSSMLGKVRKKRLYSTCTANNKLKIDLTRGCKLLPCIYFLPPNSDNIDIFQCRIIKLRYDLIVYHDHVILFKTSPSRN